MGIDPLVAYFAVFGVLFLLIRAPWILFGLALVLWTVISLLYVVGKLLDIRERRAARREEPPDPIGDAIRAENLRRADATYFGTTA